MTHFEVSFPVRYYETDQMAVVHHSNYIRYFEIARNAMMVAWGFPIERCESEYGVMIPIVSVECRFKHPARMGDVLTAVAEIDRTPLAKLVVRQAVLNQDGEVCADGSVTLGFIDAKTFRPVRCPELLAEIIENHQNDK
jgi:acyl-CoA thioester hydrolase